MSYTFPVETSARHVHLTAEDFATLFGPDAQLTVKKELSIKGQFASNEKVTVVGPKKSQPNVSIHSGINVLYSIFLLEGNFCGQAYCPLLGAHPLTLIGGWLLLVSGGWILLKSAHLFAGR